jgi:hypothetical protein
MASFLDLPPELVIMILSYLGYSPEHPGPKRPCAADGNPQLCPCMDSEKIMEQLLTCASGRRAWEAKDMQRDVVRFGISHPYLMDCIDQSGYCEMVDAWAPDSGLVWPNTLTIPLAVR